MPGTLSDLGRLVKSKHPEYKDIDDTELGRKVQAKFPGAYDDFKGESVKGLAPGQPLPGIHAPKVQMQEALTPSNVVSNLNEGAANGFIRNMNPVNIAKGLYQTGVDTINDPFGVKRSANEVDQYTNELQHPSNPASTDVVKGVGDALGGTGAVAAQYGIGEGLSRVKAPIGARMAAEESKLDQAGIVPPAQNMVNSLDDVRNRNLTSQGVAYSKPLEKKFGQVENQITGIYSDPNMPAQFSELSKLKSTLQKDASKNFFDTGKVVASKEGAGQASRAIRGVLRDTPGAEDWAQLQDEAARGHRIDENVGKVGAVLGSVASPALGFGAGHGPGGIIGALGIPTGAKLGQRAGEAASHYFTSGEAANQLKPIAPAVKVLPLVKNNENQ